MEQRFKKAEFEPCAAFGIAEKLATLRSGWIIETDSEIPKLTTYYPI